MKNCKLLFNKVTPNLLQSALGADGPMFQNCGLIALRAGRLLGLELLADLLVGGPIRIPAGHPAVQRLAFAGLEGA